MILIDIDNEFQSPVIQLVQMKTTASSLVVVLHLSKHLSLTILLWHCHDIPMLLSKGAKGAHATTKWVAACT